MLNVASAGIYTKLPLIVNFKWNACKKMKVIAEISCYFERSVVTLKLRKEYLNSVTYNTPVLLRIKYWTVILLYVNIYGSYKLLKTVRYFWPTLYIRLYSWNVERRLCRKIGDQSVNQNTHLLLAFYVLFLLCTYSPTLVAIYQLEFYTNLWLWIWI